MPLMRMLVCFDGRISHSHSFISILLERSPHVPLSFSTFHASHSLLLCSIARLTALALFYLLFLFFSRVLLARCVHTSPCFSFPPFLPITSTALTHYFPFQNRFLLSLRSKYPYFPSPFYYVTPLQYHSTARPHHITLPSSCFHLQQSQYYDFYTRSKFKH